VQLLLLQQQPVLVPVHILPLQHLQGRDSRQDALVFQQQGMVW
jgi:hypothetical protein